MLVACRLAGLSALETYYAGVKARAQCGVGPLGDEAPQRPILPPRTPRAITLPADPDLAVLGPPPGACSGFPSNPRRPTNGAITGHSLTSLFLSHIFLGIHVRRSAARCRRMRHREVPQQRRRRRCRRRPGSARSSAARRGSCASRLCCGRRRSEPRAVEVWAAGRHAAAPLKVSASRLNRVLRNSPRLQWLRAVLRQPTAPSAAEGVNRARGDDGERCERNAALEHHQQFGSSRKRHDVGCAERCRG